MKDVYRELAKRVRGEVSDLDRMIQRAFHAWLQVQRLPDEQAYVDSVALKMYCIQFLGGPW